MVEVTVNPLKNGLVSLKVLIDTVSIEEVFSEVHGVGDAFFRRSILVNVIFE